MTVTSWSILHLVRVVEFLFGHLWRVDCDRLDCTLEANPVTVAYRISLMPAVPVPQHQAADNGSNSRNSFHADTSFPSSWAAGTDTTDGRFPKAKLGSLSDGVGSDQSFAWGVASGATGDIRSLDDRLHARTSGPPGLFILTVVIFQGRSTLLWRSARA
jgi:hypothetical protein